MGNHQLSRMPPKKTKEAIAKAASSSGGKGKKKKWSKGKSRDKLSNAVLFDPELYKKIVADVPKQRVITIANVSEKFRLNGSLARETLLHLHSKGLIREVSKHNSMLIYTRVTGQAEGEEGEDKAKSQAVETVVNDA